MLLSHNTEALRPYSHLGIRKRGQKCRDSACDAETLCKTDKSHHTCSGAIHFQWHLNVSTVLPRLSKLGAQKKLLLLFE